MTDARRKGENENEFRRVNERLEVRALATRSSESADFEVVCECDREECTARIVIRFEEYEAVRSNPAAFIVVPGHTDPSCEHIISANERYEVVEKFGAAGAAAESDEPRDNA